MTLQCLFKTSASSILTQLHCKIYQKIHAQTCLLHSHFCPVQNPYACPNSLELPQKYSPPRTAGNIFLIQPFRLPAAF